MDTRRVRTLVAGWGAVLVGGGGAAYTAVQWGPSLVTAFLLAFAPAGGLLLTGRERALYRYAFPLLTAVAAVIAAVFYVREGVVAYTLLFAVLTATLLFRSVQAYRVLG